MSDLDAFTTALVAGSSRGALTASIPTNTSYQVDAGILIFWSELR